MAQELIVLIVRFTPKAGMYDTFKTSLFELIEAMKHEEGFINAIVHDDVEEPGVLCIYEIWRGTKESFLTVEMAREYRAPYGKIRDTMLDDIRVDWLTPIAEWGSDLTGLSKFVIN